MINKNPNNTVAIVSLNDHQEYTYLVTRKCLFVAS